ncbi:MAG: hypothetical protein ACP5C3_08975 [Methanomicrobiales archaeon]
MEKEDLILPAILILVFLILIVAIFSFSGNNTFQTGNVYFEYPNNWAQDHVVGNFSNSSIYSEVTLTASFNDDAGQTQTAYIIFIMQKRTEGLINIPSTNSILMNTTNSSVSSVSVGNFQASQIGNIGNDIAQKLTIIQTSSHYYVVEYITPSFAFNQTENAYNQILETIRIS